MADLEERVAAKIAEMAPYLERSGGHVELVFTAGEQGLDNGERHLDVHLGPVLVFPNFDDQVAADFRNAHVIVAVFNRNKRVVVRAPDRVHKGAKVHPVDVAPDLHLAALEVIGVNAGKHLLSQG